MLGLSKYFVGCDSYTIEGMEWLLIFYETPKMDPTNRV
jgi:hypothetical protein